MFKAALLFTALAVGPAAACSPYARICDDRQSITDWATDQAIRNMQSEDAFSMHQQLDQQQQYIRNQIEQRWRDGDPTAEFDPGW